MTKLWKAAAGSGGNHGSLLPFPYAPSASRDHRFGPPTREFSPRGVSSIVYASLLGWYDQDMTGKGVSSYIWFQWQQSAGVPAWEQRGAKS